MRKIIILPILLFFISCSNKTIPLKGKYQSQTFYQNTATPFDRVWDKLVDFFATNGLSIKVIDRSSGLIVSDKILLPVTTEDKNGMPENHKAYVVVPKVYNPGSRMYYAPDNVMGEWNVRIKSDEKGGTLINVNLVNISAYSSLSTSKNWDQTTYIASAVSTGVFEKFIFDTIK